MKKLLPLLFLLPTACATMGVSTVMKETKDGGRVMLHGTGTYLESGAQTMADKQMSAKCPQGYEVIETGMMERPSTAVNLSHSTHKLEKYIDFKCKTVVGQK